MKRGYVFISISPSTDGSSKVLRIFKSNEDYAPRSVTYKRIKYYKYSENSDEGVAKYHNKYVPGWDIIILFGDKKDEKK